MAAKPRELRCRWLVMIKIGGWSWWLWLVGVKRSHPYAIPEGALFMHLKRLQGLLRQKPRDDSGKRGRKQ
jgi:hypothetical protein